MTSPIAWPPSGHYILAVSGGADSMVLLDLMARAARSRLYDLVVAHFDHGIRPGSPLDRKLVQAAAVRLGLPFEFHQANLGAASEAAARQARHAWLQQLRAARQAAAVITAHHQDDLIETSLLNLNRGTGRRGLAPMQTGPILRPLLRTPRADLRAYAAAHHINWREDSTNADLTNPRNLLRHQLSQAPGGWRAAYLAYLSELAGLNTAIDRQLDQLVTSAARPGSTYQFPHSLIRTLTLAELQELLLAVARHLRPDFEPNRRLTCELALFAKTAPPHRRRPFGQGLQVSVHPGSIRVY